jgi:hypothetical protein
MAKYTNQIVVFLDVLGIKNKLQEFENEALSNSNPEDPIYHESRGLNGLLEIFKSSLDLIREAQCNYYVFSDNVCISISYITQDSENPDALIEILVLVSRLTSEFAKQGYFIRGGVDVGWFLNYPEIAVGQPLVTAYNLESRLAVYPRVLLSDSFIKLLQEYLDKKKIREDFEDFGKLYVKNDGALSFVNPFSYIIQHQDKPTKIQFLRDYSRKIKEQLAFRFYKKKVREKYVWLGLEFDAFLKQYSSAYREFEDPDLEYTSEEIQEINGFKVFNVNLPIWLLSTFPVLGLVNRK